MFARIKIYLLTGFLAAFAAAPFFQMHAMASQEIRSTALQDFLSGLDITFDEYLDIAAQFEEAGTYLHYLQENESRYSAYRQANPGIAEGTAIAYVNVNVDFGAYNEIQEVPEEEQSSITMLVNKNFALPENWTADMTDIGSGFLIQDEAAGYLTALRDTMRNAGMRMFPVSTYRTYASSRNLYSNALNSYGREIADLNWARAGHSEHQTGLAADILHRTDSPTLTEARFENTEEYEWMRANAHNYGFILRYPKEYENITGYKFEPWHWRYVGIPIATAMFDRNIDVYEEFYGRYLAADVLENAKILILEQRAALEAQERERLEREEAERIAAEEAARAQEQARIEQESREAREAQERAAQREELARQAEIARLAAEEEAARGERMFIYIITLGFAVAMCCTITGAYFIDKRKRGNPPRTGKNPPRTGNNPPRMGRKK